jgi:hypothetical protein
MTQENPIGLAELIDTVRQELLLQELLSTGPGSGNVPFLSIDEVSLELQVTVQKEGNAGIKINVIQIGGSVSRNDVQTIKITLTPLLSKEARLSHYQKHYPGGEALGAEAVERVSTRGTLKGSAEESQRETFGDE